MTGPTPTLMSIFRFALLVLAVTTAFSLVADDGRDGDDGHASGLKTINAPQNMKYKEECGGCHLAYPPGLLPERSWLKMMNDLEHHFGESAEVEQAGFDEILHFLTENAADKGSRRSRKIANSIPSEKSPLRITETPYFQRKHREVKDSIWKRKSIASKSNCGACHLKAENGRFSEHEVRIPR